MKERNWLIPAICLTVLSAALPFMLVASRAQFLPALDLLPYWMLAAAAMALAYSLGPLFRMMRGGVERPIARIAEYVRGDWRRIAFIFASMLIAGVNMIAFMAVKPLLNYVVPFWADPLLANADRILFLGTDPWRFLTWMNSSATSIFYHRGWFALMILALLLVLVQPPSRERSAMLTTYFLLWSVAGPLVHCLLPAAGPVFFDELGYGGRFTGLAPPEETRQAASYLWAQYSIRGFGGGAGISAMPSLHIATTAWIVMAVWVFARRWTAPIAGSAVLIFLLSISLSWHYAVDGIAGALLTVAIYAALARAYGRTAPGSAPRFAAAPPAT